MKVIFIVPYPTEGASTRYRVEQFIPYLRQNGVECTVKPFVSPKFYKILYKKSYCIKKLFYFFICSAKRFVDIFRALRYDVIFIHLETFPFGPPAIEYFWAILGKKIIFDLDDAIYMKSASFANQYFKFLKCPSKIPQIIKLSKHIITCNAYLKKYAQQFKERRKIDIIHTAIDTEKFAPKDNKVDNKKLVIGWIGSYTTSIYLNQLRSVLQKLAKKYDFLLRVVGAGRNIEIPGVKIENIEWSLEKDVENFHRIDIGIYPLIESEWIKGKTGFKTIQYMSVGAPCVVSNLGSNKEIVQNGTNGFLALTDEEWINKLSLLIENLELRKKIGLAGRKTVEEKFSINANASKYLEILQNTYNERYKR